MYRNVVLRSFIEEENNDNLHAKKDNHDTSEKGFTAFFQINSATSKQKPFSKEAFRYVLGKTCMSGTDICGVRIHRRLCAQP
ncbi:uncharacterized protein ACN427_003611 isoform 2-T4 [Glossina fuscipes fuscipes]